MWAAKQSVISQKHFLQQRCRKHTGLGLCEDFDDLEDMHILQHAEMHLLSLFETSSEDLCSSGMWLPASQGNIPWVDSACADCPGFLGPGAAGARLPALSRSLRLCPRSSICFMAPWTFAWICCPRLPYHLCKNVTHSTSVTIQGYTHRAIESSIRGRGGRSTIAPVSHFWFVQVVQGCVHYSTTITRFPNRYR